MSLYAKLNSPLCSRQSSSLLNMITQQDSRGLDAYVLDCARKPLQGGCPGFWFETSMQVELLGCCGLVE